MRKATVNKVKLYDILYSPDPALEVKIIEIGSTFMRYEVGGFTGRVVREQFNSFFKDFFIKPKFIDYYDIL